jgi:parallel beta-helix repeat protein
MGRLLVLAVTLALALTAPAYATSFTVNTTSDVGSDPTPNDEICGDADTGTGGVQCTLRAAIQESNSDADTDTIGFEAGVQGQPITLPLGVLSVTQPVTINGCTTDGSTADTATAPCVGVRATSTGVDIFSVTAIDVFLRGLALTNGRQAIFYGSGQTGLRVENSRFGIKLDGTTAEGDETGISLIGNTAVIGGTTPGQRNVFANIIDTAIDLFTGDNNQIKGNYFGTKPDGTIAAAKNGKNIAVRGNGSGSDAEGNVIGGGLSTGERDSAACDGPCNVIANATGDGVFLGTDIPNNESGAQGTVINGNHIGLDATGNSAAGNGTGVDVSQSDFTSIGAATTDRNLIGGNTGAGVSAGNGSTGLVVQNDYFGLNAAGNAALPDGQFEAVLSGGTFSNNRVGGSATNPSSSGLLLDSPGGTHTVQGNTFGLGTGNENVGLPNAAIEVNGSGNLVGSPAPLQNGTQNTIKNTRGAGSAGILISSGGSTFRKNIIQSNQGAGIRIENQASGNIIGDDSDAFLANNLSQNVGNAIELVEDGTDENLIASNRGFSNGGLFIDLGKDGAGNAATGPNGGIAAPLVIVANPSTMAGTSTPGAKIRVYERDSNPGSGLSGFFGTTTADGTGHWTFDFTTALNPAPAPGTPVVATQTASSSSNTSELSADAIVTAVPAPPTLTGTDPASPANNNAPRIKGGSAAGTTVKLYANASCSGAPAATGTDADFASPGLQVSVADNSSTTFHATATAGPSGPSACSSSSVTYVESTPAATGGGGGAGGATQLPGAPSSAALLNTVNTDLGELGRALRKLGIDGLLRKGGVTIRADALTGGTDRFDAFLTSVTSAASTKFLTGKRTFTAAGKAKLRLKLTKKGRRKLRRARRARIRLRGTFTPVTGKAVTGSRKATLRRKKKR